jgi:hypothetical protein
LEGAVADVDEAVDVVKIDAEVVSPEEASDVDRDTPDDAEDPVSD